MKRGIVILGIWIGIGIAVASAILKIYSPYAIGPVIIAILLGFCVTVIVDGIDKKLTKKQIISIYTIWLIVGMLTMGFHDEITIGNIIFWGFIFNIIATYLICINNFYPVGD